MVSRKGVIYQLGCVRSGSPLLVLDDMVEAVVAGAEISNLIGENVELEEKMVEIFGVRHGLDCLEWYLEVSVDVPQIEVERFAIALWQSHSLLLRFLEVVGQSCAEERRPLGDDVLVDHEGCLFRSDKDFDAVGVVDSRDYVSNDQRIIEMVLSYRARFAGLSSAVAMVGELLASRRELRDWKCR